MTDILVKALRGSLETVPLLEQVMPEAPGSSSASHPPLRESGPGVRQVSAPQAPLAATAAPVVAPPDADGTFDFGEPAAAAPGTSSSWPKRARATRKPRVPVWAWTAAVTLLIVALAVTAVTFLAIQNGDSNPYKDAPPPENKTNSIGMKLALIHAGWFLMGSPANEQGRYPDERPQHKVEITRPFYMGVSPVTRGQFAAFVDTEHYKTEAEVDGQGGFGFNAAAGKWEVNPEYTWRHPGFDQTDEHPVVTVFVERRSEFLHMAEQKGGQDLRAANGSGVGVQLPCGDSYALLVWRHGPELEG